MTDKTDYFCSTRSLGDGKKKGGQGGKVFSGLGIALSKTRQNAFTPSGGWMIVSLSSSVLCNYCQIRFENVAMVRCLSKKMKLILKAAGDSIQSVFIR